MIKRRKIKFILFLIIFIFVSFRPANIILAIEKEEYNNIIYNYEDFKSKALILKVNNSIDFSDYDVIDINYIDDKTLILTFDSIDKTIEYYKLLKNKSYVEFIEPDMYIELSEDEIVKKSEENIIKYNSWGIEHLGIDKYAKYLKEENIENIVTIAVIDSGIDYNHPIFEDKLLDSGYDFVNNDDNPYDDNIQGHGTHVAGIIADSIRELDNIKIMPIKSLDSIGIGTISSLGNSIRYAIDSDVDIINLSLGLNSGIHSKLIEELILEAVSNGIIVVNAAGNSNSNTMDLCPSHIDEAIIVSSIDINNNKAYTSNYGPNIDVAAPGVNIYSSIPGGDYIYKSGTSMAAPYISVIAAMLKLSNPELTPLEIENLIKKYSVDIGEEGEDWYFGSGVPNMKLALPKVDLENIEFDNTEINLDIGNYFELNIEYYPENFINDSEVKWESSDNEVAVVDNGKVLAIKEGEAIIKATILDKTAFCKVIVKSVDTLDLEEKSLSLNESNEKNSNNNIEIKEKIDTEKEVNTENNTNIEDVIKEEIIKEEFIIEKKINEESIEEDKTEIRKELEEDSIGISGDSSDLTNSYEQEKMEYIENNSVIENNINDNFEENNENEEIESLYTDNTSKSLLEKESSEENDIEVNGTLLKENFDKNLIFILIGLIIGAVIFIGNKVYKS